MDGEPLRDYGTIAECLVPEDGRDDASHADDRLSVVVIYDRPFDAVALDEALFSLAIQDYEHLEVVLVLPDCGRAFHRRAERGILAQSWPSAARARVASVAVRASETIAARLLNAGMSWATGRYVAFLHHQDLVYQHAYRTLIDRLRGTDAAVAFGGVRIAQHARACRHWMVTGKDKPKANSSRLSKALDGRGALHAFVMDRVRLAGDYLFAHNPESRLATTVFFSRLALHEKADFSLSGEKMVESRTPPPLSASSAAECGRLPSAAAVLTALAGDGFSLRPDALSVTHLFADAVRSHNSEMPSPPS